MNQLLTTQVLRKQKKMTDKKHCNYIIGGSDKKCDHLHLDEPIENCFYCQYYVDGHKIERRKEREKDLARAYSDRNIEQLKTLLEIEPDSSELRGWGLKYNTWRFVISELIQKKLDKNKDALLLFLSENSLEVLNAMLLQPVPTQELQTWSLTLDEYKAVIQKAIQNISNDVIQDVTIKSTHFINQESVLPEFVDDGSVLFCDSLRYPLDSNGKRTTVKGVLPFEISLIHRDKDGAEIRSIYKFLRMQKLVEEEEVTKKTKISLVKEK